jgi:GntR family transcriptional repressor for pyruvate dehydrogenase complex
MKAPFKQIKPKRVSDQVFEQLRELIFRGELKAGEQLMPERELATAMGVSRTTIRDAINKLVVMGLLEHKQGQGTFVRSPASGQKNPLAAAIDAQNPTLADLLEVRMGMECNAAAMAALRADSNDIEFLKKSLEEMKTRIRSGQLGTEEDVAFHMAIAYATKNQIQVYLMKNFYDYLFYGIKENLYFLYDQPERIELIQEQHEAILAAIENHSPDDAHDAMKRHIRYVLEAFASSKQG